MSDKRTYRCAIYTRVSTDHGLDQEFNSLDAQHEACAAFIKSQGGEGWRLSPSRYDDGGYSGGSMERPALQQLLQAIRAKSIDTVVVYKVDRLTRSLADFAKLVELFDGHSVSFVSVTQSFNTTTSMGRLTLNVLLSFAQFEREVTGERIRDKIAASKKKGLRVGGPVPLGYVVKDKKLMVEPEEAATVRLIFRRYLELGSLTALVQELGTRGVRTKRTRKRDGSVRGGVAFRKGALAYLVRNRIYVGDVIHKGQNYIGEHEPIVPTDLFAAAQEHLSNQAMSEGGMRLNTGSPLIGKLFDDSGNRMTPSTTNKGGVRYRYYVSSALLEGRKSEAGSVARVPADGLERAVRAALKEATKGPASAAPTSIDELAKPKADLLLVANKGDHPEVHRDEVLKQVQRVIMHREHLEVTYNCRDEQGTIAIPWTIQQSRRRRELLNPGQGSTGTPIRSETRARLVEGLAMARSWVDQLVSGQVASTHEIAQRERLSERSIRMTLNLAFLSPALTKAAVEGRLPRALGICRLVDCATAWERQL